MVLGQHGQAGIIYQLQVDSDEPEGGLCSRRERRLVVMGDGDAKAAPRQRTSQGVSEYLILVEDQEGGSGRFTHRSVISISATVPTPGVEVSLMLALIWPGARFRTPTASR